MKEKRISIPVGEEKVSGIISMPGGYINGTGTGVIIAHGAGTDMHNSLLEAFARGLAQAGFPALRFNFPYKEKGKKAPDSQKVLIETWKSALQFFREYKPCKPARIVAAGKSMGSRIASQMAADGILDAEGLIFLGYPLHAPGIKENLRDAHLYQIILPMLFIAGTRDALCDLESLKAVLKRLKAPWDLLEVPGGDHFFTVPKSLGTDEEEVSENIIKKAVSWLQG